MAGLFFLSLFAETGQAAGDIQIQGKSLFTFTSDHFVIQSDKYFYKVSKIGLPPATQFKLENSTGNGELISVDIPRSKIEYSWPNLHSAYDGRFAAAQEEPKAEDGQIILNGSLQLSFSDEYFFIQAQDSVYQVKKSALSEKQIRSLLQTNTNTRIIIAIPHEAIQGAWSFKQNLSRNIASVDVPDSFEVVNSILTLNGIILYSANDGFVTVQSGARIYQLKRIGISTKQPELLNVPGSKVYLTLPVANIEAHW